MARRSLVTGALVTGRRRRLAYPVGVVGAGFTAKPDREVTNAHATALWWNEEAVCSSCGHTHTRALHDADYCERFQERRGHNAA